MEIVLKHFKLITHKWENNLNIRITIIKIKIFGGNCSVLESRLFDMNWEHVSGGMIPVYQRFSVRGDSPLTTQRLSWTREVGRIAFNNVSTICSWCSDDEFFLLEGIVHCSLHHYWCINLLSCHNRLVWKRCLLMKML